MRRYVSIVDITVAAVAAVAIFVSVVARPLEGVAAAKGDDEARFVLAAAEGRVRARPGDGAAADELSRRLIDAGETDLAVEAPAAASRAVKDAPTRWRALYATSRAYAELREVVEAYKWAQAAQDAYHDDDPAYPSWEKLKVDLYATHLAGGIEYARNLSPPVDPDDFAKSDPDGFRKAGEKALHLVHLGGNPQVAP